MTTPPGDAVFGAVLCGGASTRMGSNKALIAVDGVAMARRAADALIAAGCQPVVTVGGDTAALRALGLAHVADEFPGDGPLGGVVTALAVGSPVAVVACDLPRLRPETIGALVAALDGHDAAIARTDRAEPLCAVWAASAAQPLRARLRGGERAMHRAIEGLDVAWVPVDAGELRNINTPGDLNSL